MLTIMEIQIFQEYRVVDNDEAEGKRLGGFGSTNK